MGGIVAKLILNSDVEDNKIIPNTKGIAFFAVPHFGSDVRDDTLLQLQNILSGMNSFMNHNSIEDKEFVEFLLDNLEISHIAKFLISVDRFENMQKINKVFESLNLPSISVIEGKEVSGSDKTT
jgi:hypothetical protein